MMMRIPLFLGLLVLAVANASTPPPIPDLFHVLADNKNLTQFNQVINKYGDLYATLSFIDNVTLLAPSDAAFNKIPYSALRDAFENNETAVIRSILDYHVVNGTHTTGSFGSEFQFLPTWLSNEEYSNVTGGAVVSVVKQAGDDIVFVSGEGSRSSLTTRDIFYTGGVIQVIDSFLIPPETFINTVDMFNLTSSGGLASKAKLDDYLDTTPDLTIFAPSNDALEGLGSNLETMPVEELAELFKYHVVNGTINSNGTVGYSSDMPNGTVLRTLQGGNLTIRFGSNSLYVNSAKIIQQDILLANGVMHVIDNVLSPNDTYAYPNPVIPTQPPILPGSAVTDIPFTSYLPSTISSFSSTSPTGAAASSTFGVSDFGAATTAMSSAVPTGNADETGSGKKKKSGAPSVYSGSGWGRGLVAAVGAVIVGGVVVAL